MVLAKEEILQPGMIDRLFEVGRCDGMEINLRKKLVKCQIWSIDLHNAEMWILHKVDQKYLETLKCGTGGGWKRSVGPIMRNINNY